MGRTAGASFLTGFESVFGLRFDSHHPLTKHRYYPSNEDDSSAWEDEDGNYWSSLDTAPGKTIQGHPNLNLTVVKPSSEEGRERSTTEWVTFTVKCWIGDKEEDKQKAVTASISVVRDPTVNIIYYPNNTSSSPTGQGTKWVSPDYQEGTTITIKRTTDFSPAYSWSSHRVSK